ncbi:MAG: hypothetical protein AAGA46_11715 [Cyanobacteria bacterium P01_F01_bin.13]
MAQAILSTVLGILATSTAVVGLTTQTAVAQGFSGSFAPEQWQLFNNRPPTIPGVDPEDINEPIDFGGIPLAPFEGSVDFTDAPESLTLLGSDRSAILDEFGLGCSSVRSDLLPLFCGSSSTFLFVTVPETSKLSFDWDYITFDAFGPSIDPFGFAIGNIPPNAPGSDGEFTELIDRNGGLSQSGTFTVSVEANQIFGFQISTADNQGGRAQATISDFKVMLIEPDEVDPTSVPEPTSAIAIAAIAGLYLKKKSHPRQ